jgi:hypothetical protein
MQKKKKKTGKNRPSQTVPMRRNHEMMMENVYAQAENQKRLDRSNIKKACAQNVESKLWPGYEASSIAESRRP